MASTLPNVVFMVGDNVGWGDICCYGVFRYSESTSGPIITPQWPFVFDLIDEPNEEWHLIEKRLDSAWVVAPVAKRLGALQQSMTRHRNVSPGEEFTGYS